MSWTLSCLEADCEVKSHRPHLRRELLRRQLRASHRARPSGGDRGGPGCAQAVDWLGHGEVAGGESTAMEGTPKPPAEDSWHTGSKRFESLKSGHGGRRQVHRAVLCWATHWLHLHSQPNSDILILIGLNHIRSFSEGSDCSKYQNWAACVNL